MQRRRTLPRRREQVIQRAGRRCEYCKSQEAFCPDTFSVDHVVPLARGGSDTEDNLAFCCQGCNGPKQDALEAPDPETGTSAFLFHPRRDRWTEHFEWNEDFSHVRGKTPTGRATVARLRLNRDGVVNLRRLLRAAGEEHPPPDTLESAPPAQA